MGRQVGGLSLLQELPSHGRNPVIRLRLCAASVNECPIRSLANFAATHAHLRVLCVSSIRHPSSRHRINVVRTQRINGAPPTGRSSDTGRSYDVVIGSLGKGMSGGNRDVQSCRFAAVSSSVSRPFRSLLLARSTSDSPFQP
jgi:hypothetical protein